MKTIRIGLLAVALTMLGGTGALTQSGQDLFQQALVKEQADGDLRAAIAIYQRIVRDFAGDRVLAAKALVQMGHCYERLGEAEAREARKAYERVVREFGDQADVATEARSRLAALSGSAVASRGTALAVRQVWAGPEVDLDGGVSPDGRYISFTDWNTGDLVVRDLVKQESRRLTKIPRALSAYADAGTFSPDGRQVAYGWCCNQDGRYELRVVGIDGSEPRVIHHSTDVGYLQPQAWSHDGKHILSVIMQQGDYHIALVSVADGAVRVLKSTLGRRFPHLSPSPDGRWIAFDYADAESPEQHDVCLVATDGTREVKLVEHPADDTTPLWMPDGKQVLFVSDRGGTHGLWLVSVVDGRAQGLPHLVKPDVGSIHPFNIIGSGSLYYALTAGTGDVYEAELDPRSGKLISSPSPAMKHYVGFNGTPEYSPNGQFLACLSSRDSSGGHTLVIRSQKTGEERRIPLEMGSQSALRWSPDSRAVLLPGQHIRDGNSLYVVDVNTGERKRLGVWSPTTVPLGTKQGWFPDGESLYFVVSAPPDAQGKAQRRLVRYPLAAKQAQDIFVYRYDEGELRWVMLSPDGQQFAFWRRNAKTGLAVLQVMPATGGQPRELFSIKGDFRIESGSTPTGLSWTSDGGYLFFAARTAPDSKEMALWRIPVTGGTPEKAGPLPDKVYHVAVHPSGSRIAFSTADPKHEVWVMENFLPAAKKPK